jgi:hypothetical protein
MRRSGSKPSRRLRKKLRGAVREREKGAEDGGKAEEEDYDRKRIINPENENNKTPTEDLDIVKEAAHLLPVNIPYLIAYLHTTHRPSSARAPAAMPQCRDPVPAPPTPHRLPRYGQEHVYIWARH